MTYDHWKTTNPADAEYDPDEPVVDPLAELDDILDKQMQAGKLDPVLWLRRRAYDFSGSRFDLVNNLATELAETILRVTS